MTIRQAILKEKKKRPQQMKRNIKSVRMKKLRR